MSKYAVGLDYGTNSVRALIVEIATGREVGTHVWDYETGEAGIIVDPSDPNLARQQPLDYIKGAEESVAGALGEARGADGFSAADVVGIGVDTTGSTPLPVDADGEPLVAQNAFRDNPSAMAWLWKDHTGHAEAGDVTRKAAELKPEYLAKCGGTYSSEWFWSKIMHCRRVAPEVFDAAHTWVEMADWIPGLLTGTTHPERLKRCICAAGHKAMFNPAWGGYPDRVFLEAIDPALGRVRATFPDNACNVGDAVGALTAEWSTKFGLPEGIPVAAGSFDAHMGAVGSGIEPGTLVKIIGTSSCDMTVAPLDRDLPDIPGLCGIVPESILPGYYGLEAGQSAVGDIFNWYANRVQPGGKEAGSHAALTADAERIKPGASGLLALDWHNGNRTILVDQRLTGMLVGMTLHTTPAEVYRALVEATAFGARVIMERFEEYGVKIDRVVNCGGISAKNALLMQIYADVLGRPMEISRSDQSCALGAAICAAVVAKAYSGFDSAIEAMTGVQDQKFTPNTASKKTYQKLYGLYKRLHDAFGVKGADGDLAEVMKELLAIREQVHKK